MVMFFFFKAILNIEHSQVAADLDDSARWEQGSRSLTGSPGGHTRWGQSTLGWELHMLLQNSVRRRIVLGQDGVSREMRGKESAPLPYFTACGARESCERVAALRRLEGRICHLPLSPSVPFSRWGGRSLSSRAPVSTEKRNPFPLAKNIDSFNRRSL